MGLREIKMGRTRRQIADHAFALFMTQGFESTTIEQIASAAEVGTRTLYRYYPTKESLIVDFVESGLGSAVEQLRKQPDDTPLPQALYTMIEAVLGVTREDTERVLAVYRLAEQAPSVKAIWAKGNCAVFDVARIDEIERETKHDIIAFLTHLAEIVGPEARFVHQGMTSSDVLDTCLNVQLVKAADILIEDIDRVLAALKKRAFEHKMTPTVGRSPRHPCRARHLRAEARLCVRGIPNRARDRL